MRFAGDPDSQSQRRSGADVRAQDHAESAAREPPTTCICRDRCAACGTKQALIASKEIILCEALIDALTFWCAGYRNVTTIYGVNNFTDEFTARHSRSTARSEFTSLTTATRRASARPQDHAEELMQMGIECFRVQFPKGQDANEYARMTQPAAKALGVMLTSAAWLGKGKRPTVSVIEACCDRSARDRGGENQSRSSGTKQPGGGQRTRERTETQQLQETAAAKEKISEPPAAERMFFL